MVSYPILVDVYYPVMNTPLDRSLQVLDSGGGVIWEADLEEVADDTDPEAGEHYLSVPTFHGLSSAGEVQGKLVYANYGMKEDYEALVEKGEYLLWPATLPAEHISRCQFDWSHRNLPIWRHFPRAEGRI